jgi:hypothetical protein
MKTKTVLSLISFLILSLSISYAGTVVVKPGRFDHFTLQAPERTIAGESFVIRAQVYDSHDNLITNFSEAGKEFKVSVTGSANVQPSYLGPGSFPGGVTNITITDKKAEPIVFSIYEAGGTVPVISKEIVISPNKLNHFIVQSPTTVTAGNSFDVRIIAKDIFDNTVTDEEMAGKNVKLTSSGTASLKTTGTSLLDFKNGTASVSLVTEKIGNVIVETQEVLTGSRGRSYEIIVNPAALNYFKVYSPKEAVAGEPFEITISAYDLYGNPVNNYASGGNGVLLQSTGSSRIEPSFIKSSEFKNNEAVIKIVYEKAEDINIIAKEHNKTQEGKSNPIKVNPNVADHFVVITPETAISGQPFKIKVEAYDRYGNLVRDYNLTGGDISLRTTGSGVLSPSIISPSEFVEGIALVEVIYDKAESFAISATVAPVKAAGRITIKEEIPVKKEVSEPAPPPKPPAVKKKIEKREMVKVKKEPIEAKKPAVKEVKKEEPKKEPKKEMVEEKKPVVKEAKVEKPEKIVKKPFTLNDVSIIEAKEKAMLVINLTPPDGQLEYKDEIESRYGKEWLKIKLKPAIRKIEKSLKFKSEFIGEVLVEEDKSEQDLLNIYVELIPAEVTFDIARIKNSLIVTVARP